MINRRNIGVCIVLTMLTCGIYGLYWFYRLTVETNIASGIEEVNPGTLILLCVATCGIYEIYWAYKMGRQIAIAQNNKGVYSDDKSILYMILRICGLGIVVYALLQSELNSFV